MKIKTHLIFLSSPMSTASTTNSSTLFRSNLFLFVFDDFKLIIPASKTNAKLCIRITRLNNLDHLPDCNVDRMRLRLEYNMEILTLSAPIPLRLHTLPYCSNPRFLIFDIRTLWRSGLSARASECQKLKMTG